MIVDTAVHYCQALTKDYILTYEYSTFLPTIGNDNELISCIPNAILLRKSVVYYPSNPAYFGVKHFLCPYKHTCLDASGSF